MDSHIETLVARDMLKSAPPPLPDGRHQLEFILSVLEKFIGSFNSVTEARDQERLRYLRQIDRARRGLDPAPWKDQPSLKNAVTLPETLPPEVAKHLVFSPDDWKAIEQMQRLEREIERIIADGTRDVYAFQLFCSVAEASCAANRRVIRPYERLAWSIRERLDAIKEGEKEGGRRRRGKMNVKEANLRAHDLAKENPAFVHLGLREWAEKIGCSWGLVSKLPLWKAKMERKRRGNNPKRPRAVGLTPEVLATHGTGGQDGILQQLVAEQKADDEPSPLEDDPPGRQRKVRSRKQV